MENYIIYFASGNPDKIDKVGCTTQFPQRCINQGYTEYRIIEETDNIDVAAEREIYWQLHFFRKRDSSTNYTQSRENWKLASKTVSDERREKYRANSTGRIKSPETKAKMAAKRKAYWDNKEDRALSDEHKQKLSEASKGKIKTEEHQNKITGALKGKKMSDHTKEQIRLANLGNTYSLGHKCSDETKEKIRIANTGRKWTEEQKSKIRGPKNGRFKN